MAVALWVRQSYIYVRHVAERIKISRLGGPSATHANHGRWGGDHGEPWGIPPTALPDWTRLPTERSAYQSGGNGVGLA